ncbi:helix-turn-helix domain-containing protein [Nonomuraea sp. NPDC048826]|uniref:helix-turn-helix domain-containing protein n=1 Tax=Nonomuraea sp. NPDC048826 TaxID=3364347 RepID=UPI00371772F6
MGEADDLLEAARAVFHAGGYAAAQIADIAKRAGTTKPTLYARLGNKEQIYLAVVRREVVNGVTDQLTGLIKRRQEAFGPDLGPVADALAAACVGVALQVCEHTIDRGGDLNAAQHLAARFVENAFHNLDLRTLAP